VLDHVTIGVSDLERSRAFYDTALAPLEIPVTRDDQYLEWGDFSISRSHGRAVTRNLALDFAARSRAHADAFARAAGDPPHDPDGNRVAAVFDPSGRPPGAILRVRLRVRDVEASRRFYDRVAPGEAGSSVEVEEGDPTQNVHFAFVAEDNAAVDAFWQRGVDAGYIDNGAPGERREYHRGYYGAFVLDPDGNNVEAVCHNR